MLSEATVHVVIAQPHGGPWQINPKAKVTKCKRNPKRNEKGTKRNGIGTQKGMEKEQKGMEKKWN